MNNNLVYSLSYMDPALSLFQRDGDSGLSNTTSTGKPLNLHGALGHWAVVCYGINISSIICSLVVIIFTVMIAFNNRSLLNRPSLRISTSIAVCDLAYSICQMFVFNNDYMAKLSEIHLRAFLWMMSGFTVTFIFLSVCIGIQLLLTVLTHKAHWADIIQPWYEVVSFICGFLVTHPYMYLFKQVSWVTSAQLFYLNDTISVSRRNVWLIQWMWVFTGIIFLFFIAVFTYLKMSQVWRVTDSNNAPEKIDMPNTNKTSTMTEERRKYIRSVTIRVSCYPIIPIITQLMVVIANLAPAPPYWLFVMANLMPSTQGIFNSLVYIMNPALDMYRRRYTKRILGIRHRKKFGKLEQSEDTVDLYPSASQPASMYSSHKDHDQLKLDSYSVEKID